MKSFITPTYTFTPGASGVGTVNLSGITSFNIKNLVSIINQTRGVIIYSTASTSLGYTAVSGSTVTLNANTTGQSSGDVLQVIYEVVSTNPAPRTSTAASIVTPAQQTLFRTTFASVQAGVDSSFFTTVSTGSGQSVSQSAGNLVITTGTTINSETILRSTSSFTGSMIARVQNILSQRIINQNFFVELVDVIGDGLTASASSATSLTVTIPNNPFTSINVGQSMYIGNLAAGLVGVPNRYAIASVSGNNVTFTVAGFTVSSGTVSLFGWNYYQQQFNGTTATSVQYDAQRRGWNSGQTAATINTTASPGVMTIMQNEDGNAYLLDQLVASAAGTSQVTSRASRVINLPEENTALFLQIRCLNGSTAPASTTTWTIGMASVENYSATQISINNVKPQGTAQQMPVTVLNTPAVTVSSGTVTSVGTVTTVSSVTAANLNIPGIITDVASAALTTTTTTATLTPTFGTAYLVNIPVTVVSGTNPTLDVSVEESADSGVNWFKVYDFPRITATGSYNSPILRLRGNRIRYVQTVGGTTPSFTRAVNRSQISHSASQITQIVNRSIDPNILNSITPSLLVEGCQDFNIFVRCTAQTTPATITLQFSDDAVNWHTTSTTLTTAVGFVHAKVQNEQWKFARATVASAGTGITLGELTIKSVGM